MQRTIFRQPFAIFSAMIVPLFIVVTSISTMAASVTLRWDPNNPTPDGYRVFARRSGQAYNYSQPAWQGGAVTCTINSLQDQTIYYFVVRAYDGSLESADSQEVQYVPPASSTDTPATGTDPVPSVTGTSIDSDGDGMPDEWESYFGLNPLVDDADGDLDSDGISNRDEYRAGLEPDDAGTGTSPNTPSAVSPASYSQVSCSPTLAASDYVDNEGDAHIATQWQVYDSSTDDCLLDVITDRRLTRLPIPALLLAGNQTYQWRLRYFDSGGRVSSWSAYRIFSTESVTNDLNGNGIPDDQELQDIPINGVMASLTPLPADYQPTGISVDSGDTVNAIEQVVVMDPAQFEADETTPDQLPSGMVAYKLILNQPGDQAQVTIRLSQAAPAGSQWVKYDSINGWQSFTDHAVFSADGRSVTLSIKDGEFGDADGAVNGIIVDPSGLAASESTASTSTSSGGGGGGGGCFIGSLDNRSPSSQGIQVQAAWQWLKNRIGHLADLVNE